MGKAGKSEKRLKGIDISYSKDIDSLLGSMENAGLQAGEISKAAQIIGEMQKEKAVVFLAFTTNIITSGMREIVAKLCREKKVGVIITAIGSVEEDVMKSFSKFELCSFEEDDVKLNKLGKNRVGNIIIPNKSYVMLEKKINAFF
jgi:deoxyhypusine synthase